jgi:hypothetical protein
VERFLLDLLARMPAEPPRSGPGRPRVLPALALWAGLLVCVLRGFSSQLALWRLLCDRQLWYFPRFAVSDQAVYKRLGQSGVAALEAFFSQLSELLAERLPTPRRLLAPFATTVVALDETTLDRVARRLPALRDALPGDPRLLGGKVAGVFDIRQQLWRTVRLVSDATQNEKRLARELVQTLPTGSLILADLGYFGFAWFDWLTDGGYWWLSRLRAKTSYEVIHTYYQRGAVFDGVVWLGRHRADRAAHAVRLVSFPVGPTVHRFISNVLDPQQCTLREFAQLYARRWDIELAVLLVKRHLGLHLLWSAKLAVIHHQLLAVLIIAQALQALRQSIAAQARCDPSDVSMALLVEYVPRYSAEGRDPLHVFVEQGRFLRFIRPSRRTTIRAPVLPRHRLAPLPPATVLLRTPRYAGKIGR